MFAKEILKNRFFQEMPLSLDNWADDLPEGVGVTYDEDGNVHFCLPAPGAQKVRIEFATNTKNKRIIKLKKDSDGLFHGFLPYREDFTGPANTWVYYDDCMVLERYLPVHWSSNCHFNIVEIPDPEMDYLLIKDVPHGAVTREIYWSVPASDWERCMIYTPPGYMNSEAHYPVLYLLNGGTENETSWFNVGRLSNILDNLIAAGDAVPFVVITVNSMLREKGRINFVYDHAVEKNLLDCCIPFVESNYRVRKEKENRAVAGLSLGAYTACDIAFNNPDVFSALGTFTACMSQTQEQIASQNQKNNYVRAYKRYLKEKDSAEFEHDFRLFFRSTTPQEDHFELFEEDDALLRQAGYDNLPVLVRKVYPARTSKWNSWRLGMRDFARLLFREPYFGSGKGKSKGQ